MAGSGTFEVILLHTRRGSPPHEQLRTLETVAGLSRLEAQTLLRATSPILRRRLEEGDAQALAKALQQGGVACAARPMLRARTSDMVEGGAPVMERFEVAPVAGEPAPARLAEWSLALELGIEELRAAIRQGRAIRRGLGERQALDLAASMREVGLSCCARGSGQGIPERTTVFQHLLLLRDWSSTELPVAMRSCGLTGSAFALEAQPPLQSVEDVPAVRVRLATAREALERLQADGHGPETALARSVLATTQRAAQRAAGQSTPPESR